MALDFFFHPEALQEYAEAADYYLHVASPRVASAFASCVEEGLAALAGAPSRWRIVEPPAIRRLVISTFPFVVYYRWEASLNRITIYAVMHCSRKPGYWRDRLPGAS